MHGSGKNGGGDGAGDGGAADAAGALTFPLSDLEERARNHAILCTVGFLILLPIGVLVARYTRTLTNRWFYTHTIIQFLISGPIILVGWSLGYKTTSKLRTGHFADPHEKIGLALLVLYVIQLTLGAVVHFFKFPSVFRGHRAPHNYFHVFLGLTIFILAQYQVHYGLFTEWLNATGGLHKVPDSAKNAWLALVVIFWVLYFVGMALIPRQFEQEKAFRKGKYGDPILLENKSLT